MVEGEQGSRPAKGSSTLVRLLAEVGALLEHYEPGELEVVPRDARERAEFEAYGQGWRDAVAQYRSFIELATVAGVPGGGRTPGQAAVIPFRRRERPDRAGRPGAVGGRGQTGDDFRGGTEEPRASSGRGDEGTGLTARAAPAASEADLTGSGERWPEAAAAAGAETAAAAGAGAGTETETAAAAETARKNPETGPDDTGAPAPAATDTHVTNPQGGEPPVFAPKNARSRAPTIPRLSRQRRPGRSGGD
ncbi:hypothetical protein [Streptomyces sp. JW3]|uniref:hypothetical protein n=1 Tax=Streptomyces sp. JW3 TaxID=3456955 RepID=UPI003FA47E5F